MPNDNRVRAPEELASLNKAVDKSLRTPPKESNLDKVFGLDTPVPLPAGHYDNARQVKKSTLAGIVDSVVFGLDTDTIIRARHHQAYLLDYVTVHGDDALLGFALAGAELQSRNYDQQEGIEQ